jgi:hypothetical protein
MTAVGYVHLPCGCSLPPKTDRGSDQPANLGGGGDQLFAYALAVIAPKIDLGQRRAGD